VQSHRDATLDSEPPRLEPDRPDWIEDFQALLGRAGSVDPATLEEASLSRGFAALQKACHLAEAERLRWLAEIDRRRSYTGDGHVSTVSWLASEFQLSGGEAAGSVRVARASSTCPRRAGRSPPVR